MKLHDEFKQKLKREKYIESLGNIFSLNKLSKSQENFLDNDEDIQTKEINKNSLYDFNILSKEEKIQDILYLIEKGEEPFFIDEDNNKKIYLNENDELKIK